MSSLHHPLRSLEDGHWFKLICGASFQHLPSVRSLALAYAWSGADCVDVAADPAVVAAALEGIRVAQPERDRRGLDRPLLMVSLNDGEDPHFRKAEFDPQRCPRDCPRPCERICPAQAIVFSSESTSGVLDSRCYGCGRCLPVCPVGQITTRAYLSAPASVMALVTKMGIDAVEIHTQVGHIEGFQRLWGAIAPWLSQLKLVAVSCPDGDGITDYLQQLYQIMAPELKTLGGPDPEAPDQGPDRLVLIWQTDGRPMSGDIGAGTTHATIQLAKKVLQLHAHHLPGFIQLAGGTNRYTVAKLRTLGLLQQDRIQDRLGKRTIAGVAYGSSARAALLPVLTALEDRPGLLEDHPDLFQQAVAIATGFVRPLKGQTSASDCDVAKARSHPATPMRFPGSVV